MNESGYEREALQEERGDAVRWWYFERRGSYAFARGGRVATARRARQEIRTAAEVAQREYEEQREARPSHKMGPDGGLIEIEWPEPTEFGGPVPGYYATRY